MHLETRIYLDCYTNQEMMRQPAHLALFHLIPSSRTGLKQSNAGSSIRLARIVLSKSVAFELRVQELPIDIEEFGRGRTISGAALKRPKSDPAGAYAADGCPQKSLQSLDNSNLDRHPADLSSDAGSPADSRGSA